MKTVAILLLAVFVLAVVVFFIYGREKTWVALAGPADLGRFDFDRQQRSRTPNDALACSPGLCAAPDVTIEPMALQPEEAIATIAKRLRQIETLVERVDDGNDTAYARFISYSALMRFPDTIDIEAQALPDGRTGIRAYSRAKLGSKDMGINRKRLERLFAPR